MKLSDIMGYANLSIYAEVAMVIFLLVFFAVSIRLWLPSRQQALRDAARLPLDDGEQALTQAAMVKAAHASMKSSTHTSPAAKPRRD